MASTFISTFVPIIRFIMGTVKGRPVNADTAYKIIIHTNGGHRYAATKQFSMNGEGKKT